ncbi:MAG: RNA polymerase subunit sigma-24, partial [Planctomycetaceae bacterium]|nr:RNA polymerase subunit sigma-24 [Planctomycetaceae bacterium]
MDAVQQDDRDSRFVNELTTNQLSLSLYVRSLLPGDSAAHDVAQQANAKIWEKRGEFELGTNFKAWAFSIARYEVLNYRKRQSRDARLVFSDDLEQ